MVFYVKLEVSFWFKGCLSEREGERERERVRAIEKERERERDLTGMIFRVINDVQII